MTTVKYLFVDDAIGKGGDADQYRKMLSKADLLDVELVRPDRKTLLVPEAELGDIDGFILDINLSDQVDVDGNRFLGTGAGLAQDLRLMQSLGVDNGGQRSRPVVRLCAAQVFQDYLEGDDSTVDIFDLGFSKELIGDHSAAARAKLAALPGLYADVAKSDPTNANGLLGLSDGDYATLHSKFRSELETELGRKTHEASSFVLRELINAPGLLMDEALLAVRLGIDRARSPGWDAVREKFANAKYRGTGYTAFARWWANLLSSLWAELHPVPLFKLTAVQRVEILIGAGFEQLAVLVPDARSPGEQPWTISRSPDPELKLPADPRFAFPLSAPVAPWLDEHVWCFEMAKRHRNSPKLAADSRSRLHAILAQAAKEAGG